ncbi:hypothetical protein L2E82_14227 [Cichorium intybus]|uniref:Uncharacterized protein n=1 Tax=Cichorium intybus TaxID=13427 RepID=A0ACB9EZE1_CICIN|nr:hypothetical protein L2E82_14227 [Cichorium intybus]
MKPPHKHFFSSLKQVEKRLKLDDGNPPPLPRPQTTQTQPTESFSSSPMYFYNQATNASSTLHDNSIEQPPQEFLSHNDTDEFPSNTGKTPHQLKNPENKFSQTSTVDDIDTMIRLLRLSDFDGKEPEMPDLGDDEFYDKIVKVKGPRCKKEVERLDGWIKYLSNNGGREPLRLAHLLLAKAAFVSMGGGGVDVDGVEFPSTVDEFLQNDPPSD